VGRLWLFDNFRLRELRIFVRFRATYSFSLVSANACVSSSIRILVAHLAPNVIGRSTSTASGMQRGRDVERAQRNTKRSRGVRRDGFLRVARSGKISRFISFVEVSLGIRGARGMCAYRWMCAEKTNHYLWCLRTNADLHSHACYLLYTQMRHSCIFLFDHINLSLPYNDPITEIVIVTAPHFPSDVEKSFRSANVKCDPLSFLYYRKEM